MSSPSSPHGQGACSYQSCSKSSILGGRPKAPVPQSGDYFGKALALSFNGDQALTGTANTGAAYLFSRTGTAWTQQPYLKAPNADAVDAFATSNAGAVYLY